MPGLRTERGHIPESGASSTRSPPPGAACPPPASANLGPLPGPLPSLSGAKNVRFRHLRETSVTTSPARPHGLSAPAAARGHARPREPGHPTVHRSRRGTPGQCGVPPPPRWVPGVLGDEACLPAGPSSPPRPPLLPHAPKWHSTRGITRSPRFPSDAAGVGPTPRSSLLPVRIPFCHLGLEVSKLSTSRLSQSS